MNERRMKAAASQAVSYRNYRRARDRALTKLSQLYPDTYKELLEREKANDEAQGRKWLDIDGTTSTTVLPVREGEGWVDFSASNNSSNKSNDGGEA
jgi:hypothetical protein